jgi:hypothetical protein
LLPTRFANADDIGMVSWSIPPTSNCWTMQHRPELLVAVAGGAHAAGDIEALQILDRSAMAD